MKEINLIITDDNGSLELRQDQVNILTSLDKIKYCLGCASYHLNKGVTFEEVCGLLNITMDNVSPAIDPPGGIAAHLDREVLFSEVPPEIQEIILKQTGIKDPSQIISIRPSGNGLLIRQRDSREGSFVNIPSDEDINFSNATEAAKFLLGTDNEDSIAVLLATAAALTTEVTDVDEYMKISNPNGRPEEGDKFLREVFITANGWKDFVYLLRTSNI